MMTGAFTGPMPWAAFGWMSDEDLQAVYRYVRSVPAVENNTGDSVRGIAVAQAAR